MKMQIIPLVAISAIALFGCGDGASDADADRALAPGATDSAAIEAIAGDKEKVALVLARAQARGTFDDAIALALKDSTMAAEVAAIIQADPRFAMAVTTTGSAAAVRAASSKSTGARTTTARSTKGTAAKGDVLDQTESQAKKVNEKLDQAARVKKEAEQAKGTIDDILGRR